VTVKRRPKEAESCRDLLLLLMQIFCWDAITKICCALVSGKKNILGKGSWPVFRFSSLLLNIYVWSWCGPHYTQCWMVGSALDILCCNNALCQFSLHSLFFLAGLLMIWSWWLWDVRVENRRVGGGASAEERWEQKGLQMFSRYFSLVLYISVLLFLCTASLPPPPPHRSQSFRLFVLYDTRKQHFAKYRSIFLTLFWQ